MRILGVDPGMATTGIGVIEGTKKNGFACLDYFCITTKAKTPLYDRLFQIHQEMNHAIIKYRPNLISVEQLFFNTNLKTAMAVGKVSGVIILAAAQNNIEVTEFTPLQVKMNTVGYGRADKKQVQKMIALHLKLKEIPKSDDAADALAIAMCAGYSV
ncbi:crossover junction endodeoxyribonuclease RuvC [candidate division WWE3 bacterium]|nr:crossover junction endodeoxyribonuclease RuvC [candidate division WWE3 bacterium]